jgi:hypothetical protein
MVNTTRIPPDSAINEYLAGADLFDAFEVPVADGERPALQIYIDLMARTPPWIDRLMLLRDRAAGVVGLKGLGHLDDADPNKAVADYRPGDHVGIFSILSVTDREVVLVESDKHLDARVSLCKTSNGYRDVVVFSTVIHIRNALGHAYMLLVWPLHKLMVPALLARSTPAAAASADLSRRKP